MIAFPATPDDGDLYSESSRTWRYDTALNAWEEVRITVADSLSYDPTASGLTATDVQAALDEVQAPLTAAASTNTPATLVKRGADGEAVFGSSEVTFAGNGLEGFSYSGSGISGTSYSGNAISGASYSGSGILGYSDTGTGFIGASDSGVGIHGESSSGTGLITASLSGTNHAEFGTYEDERSFIRRVLGLFGWIRGAYSQTIGSPDTLSADSDIRLPDVAAGTIALVETTATFAQGELADTALQPDGDGSSLTGVIAASLTDTQAAPAADDPGVAGQMVFTDTYTYRCFATGDWRRVAVTYAGSY